MEKKRIALIVTSLAALLAGTAKAHIYHNDNTYRTRWSMYKYGLISGDWKWSMERGDLVPGEIHYSPYAFSPSHPTGLVWGNKGEYSISSLNQQEVLYKPSSNNSNNSAPSVAFLICNFPVVSPETKSFEELKAEDEAKQAARKESIEERKAKIARREETRRSDPVNELYQYLNKTNASFKNDNPLIFDGEVAGTTFFLNGKKGVLYLNIDKIREQKGFVRIKTCKDYLDNLSGLVKQSVEEGWSICFVTFENGKIRGLEALTL